MTDENLKLAVVVSQPFGENTYVLWRGESKECLIVDPGFEPDKITALVDQEGLTPAAILNTHGHADHIAGNEAMKQQWPECPLVIGAGDEPKLTDAALNLSAGYGISLVSPPADETVVEGKVYKAAGIELEVLEIPGHSIGHIVFVWKAAQPWMVIGGDVLFQGSIGRTDFPDGSFEDLRDSIWQKLFTLPDDTIVLPGHGPETTIKAERVANPFVGEPAGYQAQT